MLPLADRADAAVRRLGRPAVPLPELALALREQGSPVSESVLLRSLQAEPERFRLIQPWRALARGSRDPEEAQGVRARGATEAPSGAWTAAAGAWASAPWVVAAPEDGGARRAEAAAPIPPSPQRDALARMGRSLAGLGWGVDDGSATDVARWLGMVVEAERFRRMAGEEPG